MHMWGPAVHWGKSSSINVAAEFHQETNRDFRLQLERLKTAYEFSEAQAAVVDEIIQEVRNRLETQVTYGAAIDQWLEGWCAETDCDQ